MKESHSLKNASSEAMNTIGKCQYCLRLKYTTPDARVKDLNLFINTDEKANLRSSV